MLTKKSRLLQKLSSSLVLYAALSTAALAATTTYFTRVPINPQPWTGTVALSSGGSSGSSSGTSGSSGTANFSGWTITPSSSTATGYFGQQFAGTTFTLTNTTNTAQTIPLFSLAGVGGASPDVFQSADTCSSTSLGPNQQCFYTLECAPTSAGTVGNEASFTLPNGTTVTWTETCAAQSCPTGNVYDATSSSCVTLSYAQSNGVPATWGAPYYWNYYGKMEGPYGSAGAAEEGWYQWFESVYGTGYCYSATYYDPYTNNGTFIGMTLGCGAGGGNAVTGTQTCPSGLSLSGGLCK